MKKCNYCNNEFEDNSKGTEKKYCSVKCRINSANKRHQEKVINKVKMEYEQSNRNVIQGNNETSIREERNESNNQDFGKGNFFNATRGVGNSDVLRLVEKNYETKIESISYELKNEQLLKENEELKRKVALLEVEIDELENDLEEPAQMGMIGGVMNQFKEDPINTINFATQLIQNLFNKKPNEIESEKEK